MTKKAKTLDSIASMNILLEKVYFDEATMDEVRPFCKLELSKIRRIFENHPFADDIRELIDTAIAYSDSLESMGYALDDLYVAVECL